jgi:hypothetical protein
MPINAAWHHKHPMPKRPTVEQRVAWHVAHAEHCGCRAISPKLAALIASTRAVTVLCTYHPKPGQERALRALLAKHWPVLHRAGLTTTEPARLWRATDKRTGLPYFVELFQWQDEAASDRAHRTRAVRAIWDPMTRVLTDMQIAVVEPVHVHHGSR